LSATVIRVFLADDEPLARERMRTLLDDLQQDTPTEVVGEAQNGLEAIQMLPGSAAHVVFLDIEMPGAGGIEVARHLASMERSPAVVFVTAHDRHAVEAFELNALDYLLKPVRAARLAAALKKAAPSVDALVQAQRGPRAHLSVVERNRIRLVPVREIVYLRAELKYVTLRTRTQEHLIEESLVSLEKEFLDSFIRIHRNCLVARAAIRGFERASGPNEEEPRWEVELEGVEERLAVSRRQWPAVREIVAHRQA
jgi:two-component system response regulator AlgR